jgi:hypothetical protein
MSARPCIGNTSRRWTTSVLLAFAAVRAADAQPRWIRGVVLDNRDQPIVAAVVIAAGGAGAITDDSGRFRVEIPHRDRITFDVRRVGFMPSRMTLLAGGDTAIAVLLLPSVQQVTGVSVTAPAMRPAALDGFERRMGERRRGAGTGHFITAADIEKMGVYRTTQALQNLPSITVRRVTLDGRYLIFGRTGVGGECPATVFLDGIRLGGTDGPIQRRSVRSTNRDVASRDGGTAIDEYTTPQEIAGIEVYPRALLAPPQFQPPVADSRAAHCAIVVVWTKHG